MASAPTAAMLLFKGPSWLALFRRPGKDRYLGDRRLPALESPCQHSGASNATTAAVKRLVVDEVLTVLGEPRLLQLADGTCCAVQGGHLGHDDEDGDERVERQDRTKDRGRGGGCLCRRPSGLVAAIAWERPWGYPLWEGVVRPRPTLVPDGKPLRESTGNLTTRNLAMEIEMGASDLRKLAQVHSSHGRVLYSFLAGTTHPVPARVFSHP